MTEIEYVQKLKQFVQNVPRKREEKQGKIIIYNNIRMTNEL